MSNTLPLERFSFTFPSELVAVEPAQPRDSSRLMVLDRGDGSRRHSFFRDLPSFLKPGDCLVLNKTKVMPARLVGRKTTGGKVELLLIKEIEKNLWSSLGPGLKLGSRIEFAGGVAATVEGAREGGEMACRFTGSELRPYLDQQGLPPIPPYILKRRRNLNFDGAAQDKERYQTVYAREEGSIAAPTAGLHFTQELLDKISASGVKIAEFVLHVGLGTFKPIDNADADLHQMLPEFYSLPLEQAKIIRDACDQGSRVTAVGTSACRTLETLARRPEGFGPGQGWTDLYIRPGHEFKIVNALVTNFHQPCSTPLMLASAFAGRDVLLESYQEAIEKRYRLFSYGDSMLIL